MATFKYINKLQDKRVLIFGGTSGMGFAVAEGALEHGANVFLSGSNQGRLDNAIQRLKTSYPDVKPEKIRGSICDLSDANNLEQNLMRVFKVASNNGAEKIDHITYTAGDRLDVAGGITGTDLKVIDSTMLVRVYVPVLVGKIIATTNYVNQEYTSSFTMTAGGVHLRPRKTWPVVSMLSGAIQGLTTGLALEIAPVRVNVVNPGIVNTELLAKRPPEVQEQCKQLSLTHRLVQPEDIAEAYLYFMKDPSADGTSVFSDNGKILS